MIRCRCCCWILLASGLGVTAALRPALAAFVATVVRHL
jgi:hypothetical protein